MDMQVAQVYRDMHKKQWNQQWKGKLSSVLEANKL